MKYNGAKWIWYPGDFEIYHALNLNLRREEGEFKWPAFWKLDDCYHNVRFKKNVVLNNSEDILCITNGEGHIQIDGEKLPLKRTIQLAEGEHEIIVAISKSDGLPSIYIEGDSIVSDSSWLANYYAKDWVPAGCNHMYLTKDSNPEIFEFEYETIYPIRQEEHGDGILYDFGKETFAKLKLTELSEGSTVNIFYGESSTEALDKEHSYLYEKIKIEKSCITLNARAFRYVFIENQDKCKVSAEYEYLPLEQIGSFACSNERINEIWKVAEYTFHLNSREFFLDGIKRDRWIWSGDAYQSYQINNYLYFNVDLSKRTIIALRGKDPVETHINTIPDYSFYWIMSVYEYYETTKDKGFVRFIYPRMKSLMDFCIERTDDNGFVQKVDDDWIFIDWANIDKTGAVCAEQMLFVKSLEAMIKCCHLLKENSNIYESILKSLKGKINKFFWNEAKGAYIDSFESGLNQVTRHANIFAILYGFADERQRESIIQNVIYNDQVPQITTPYFKFYELDVMARLNKLEYVTEQIENYWGSMLDMGVSTFWEVYDPKLELEQQYSMYGHKYGKSLCHAWGASPIYLLGKYYLGVRPTSEGYDTFEVKPCLGGLKWFKGTVPINGGKVEVEYREEYLRVVASKTGGLLHYDNKSYPLEKDIPLEIKLI